MNNLLFISSHLPSLKVPQAGQKLAYAALRDYARKYKVYLVSFVNEVEETFIDDLETGFCEEVHLFRVTNRKRIISVVSNIMLPVRVAARADHRARSLVARLTSDVHFEAVHFEFTSAAYYLKYIAAGPIKSITEHDVTYQSLERKWHLANGPLRCWYRFEYARQKQWELEVLAGMDEIVVLNVKDRNLLVADGVSPGKIRTVKPLVDPSFSRVRRLTVEARSILFWGAMNREENIDAVRWFANAIFPRILNEAEDAKLYVVGAAPPADIIELNSSKVIITGYVDDPLEYFERCHVSVAPLRKGAGIKMKVLEYLAAGMPVVATSVGAEGIEDDCLSIADDEDGFARAVLNEFADQKQSTTAV